MFIPTSGSQISNDACSLAACTVSSTSLRPTYFVCNMPAKVPAAERDRQKQLEGCHWKWARGWTESTGRPKDPWNSKEAATRDWETRWKSQNHGAPAMADHNPAAKAFQGSHLQVPRYLKPGQKKPAFEHSYFGEKSPASLPLLAREGTAINPPLILPLHRVHR